MKFWVLLISGAVSPYLFTSTLPSAGALVLLLLTALLCLGLANDYKVFCLVPCFFLINTLAINERISQRLPLSKSKSTHELTGVIAGLPESQVNGVRFLFLPDKGANNIASRIYVNWYEDRQREEGAESGVPRLRAGERWRLQLVLRSTRGRVNFHGVDTERWYFTEGIDALAYVKDGDNTRLAPPASFNLHHWREMVLDKLIEKAEGVPAFRVLVALAIADRRRLQVRDREILSATGTGHLLAISGLHIGLAAVMGFYLGKLSLLLLSTGLQLRMAIALPWLTAWLMAFCYSALSGFGVSTQRALIMLTVATLASLSRRNIHPFQAWLIAMSLVLIADPFAPLRAGFWFSFIAVGVLMMLFVPRHGPMPGWRRMLLAQFGISLLMAPLGMYWFQQTSLPGLLANLVAIPIVSMFIVPLVLTSLAFLWLPGSIASWLLELAGYLASWLMLTLDYLSGIQPHSYNTTHIPGLTATVLAMLGAAILLLPRGIPFRIAGLFLMLPLLLPANDSPGEMETRIDFLDVGQGLSVLLTTHDYQLLYDTGPGNGVEGEAGSDMVRGTIQPMIRANGRKPDLIVVSHADLDHSGGLNRLRSVYPGADYLASLPESRPGIRVCSSPGTWVTKNLGFRILHPSTGLPYLGNDSSCVISVNGAGLSLLLSGDISRAVEQRLVNDGLEQHAVLTAPHHGSSTSSSQSLIDAVMPSWVLISAAHGNRFDFPRTDVLKRYANSNVTALTSARCGGVRMTTDGAGGIRISSARILRKAIWRWPAIGKCPEVQATLNKFEGI